MFVLIGKFTVGISLLSLSTSGIIIYSIEKNYKNHSGYNGFIHIEKILFNNGTTFFEKIKFHRKMIKLPQHIKFASNKDINDIKLNVMNTNNKYLSNSDIDEENLLYVKVINCYQKDEKYKYTFNGVKILNEEKIKDIIVSVKSIFDLDKNNINSDRQDDEKDNKIMLFKAKSNSFWTLSENDIGLNSINILAFIKT